jgi:hypothetical protein
VTALAARRGARRLAVMLLGLTVVLLDGIAGRHAQI